MQMSIRVDLHKTQFTTCILSNDREVKDFGKFLSKPAGYKQFLQRIKDYQEQGFEVSMAVESTGNTRYFKNLFEKEGFRVVVVNTCKFKVIDESVKKTDKYDALTLAEFPEKDMLPESHLCSEESEHIIVPWVQNSNMTVHHGSITKRGPKELRTAYVQVVMSMIRAKKQTGAYRLIEKYQTLKANKGSGKSMIAIARKMSVVVWTMLKNKTPFNPAKMLDNKEYWDIQAAVCDAAAS